MKTTHRYGIFMAGFYGNTLQDSMLTKCINAYSVKDPEIAQAYPMTEVLNPGCFCIFYQEESAYHLDLLFAVTDEYIDTVFVYDMIENLLLIYKGVGDAQKIFENYEEHLTKSYEHFFAKSFDTEDCVDMRYSYLNPN